MLILVCSNRIVICGRNNYNSKVNYLDIGTKTVPHSSKPRLGGGDALYTTDKILVVADGIGGWGAEVPESKYT